MRKAIIAMMMVLGLAYLLPAPASAQNGELLMERLQNEIELTDQVMSRAWERVRASDDETAQEIMKLANARQEWAKEQLGELRKQFRLRLHSAAMTATEKAREQARNALAAVNRSDRHEGMVARRLERTEQLLEQIRQEGQNDQNRERLMELYDQARRTLDRAWEFHREANYRPALKLGNQAAATARQILQALRSDDRGMEQFERHQLAVNLKIEQAREKLQCDWVVESIDAAEESYMQALEMADKGEHEAAERLLMKANNQVSQAIQSCTGMERVDHGLERLEQQLADLKEQGISIEGGQKESFEALLRQAEEQIKLAHQYRDQDAFEPAKISIEAATKAMNQARRILELY